MVKPASQCEGSNDNLVRELVPAMPIDVAMARDFGSNGPCFASAKVDVEGSESLAIRGATSIFNGTCPPCLVVVEQAHVLEVDASPEATGPLNREKPVSLLHSLGYRCRDEGFAHFHCFLQDPARDKQERCSKATKAIG